MKVINASDLRAAYPVGRAWRDLGLSGVPGKTCRSPFPGEHRHGDANPSFSVFDGGRRWKDFATGESGDVIDLVRKARQCSIAEAFDFVRRQVGAQASPGPGRSPDKPPAWSEVARRLPALRRGTTAELGRLTEQRGFGADGLLFAEEKGLLRFCSLFGFDAWCITDARGQLFEFRRLDGRPWEAHGSLPARKSHCIGTGKRWPIGTVESLALPKLAFVEGAPDLLAACHFILVEGKAGTVAPVAALGASNRKLDPEALLHFRGKSVRIFPHLDDAGRSASRAWALQLKEAGAAHVDAFDVAGLAKTDGSPGKDLADVARIHPDTFERLPKFGNLMP